MDIFSELIYEFDEFQFDAKRRVLYFRGTVVPGAGEKTLEVLAAILSNPNHVVTHEEILRQAWPEAKYGADKTLVNQYASKLTKLFNKYCPGKIFLENHRGRGYMFTGEINLRADKSKAENETPRFQTSDQHNDSPGPIRKRQPHLSNIWIILGSFVVLSLIIFSVWWWYPVDPQKEIERVVRESQVYESLVLYKNPTAFKEEDLDKYWLVDGEEGINFDRRRIREAVAKLVSDGRHYGDETKCEQFDFQSVEINANRDFAAVRTLEKWFVAIYFNDGSLQRNRTIGPYFVSYKVRKMEGRWLVERSTTARVNRPIPRVSQIEAVSEVIAGKQFLVKITGQDFEDATIFIEVFGPGCPESRPCKVPNSALLETAKLSETVLDNVPLTLDSGDFKISVRNGDSKASEPLHIQVP